MATLDPIFAPRTVAVLGVSRNPAKLGYRLLQNVKERMPAWSQAMDRLV